MMPMSDSLDESFEVLFREAAREHADAIRQYLEMNFKADLQRGDEPMDILKRELRLVFRRGVSKYLRVGLWSFLEESRKKRGLTEAQVADKSGITQSTYAKIRTGESSFESILMVLRGLGVDLRSVPTLPIGEQTMEGLLEAMAFLKSRVFVQTRAKIERLNREDAEWLLHLEQCKPWIDAYIRRDREKAHLIAECMAPCLAIRLDRTVEVREFKALCDLWNRWQGAWEICMAAIIGRAKASIR